MALWLLTLFILFIGTLFVFLSKNKNIRLVLVLFWIPALIGVICPALNSLSNGVAYGASTVIAFWGQNLTGIIDPLSAFFLFALSLIGIIYVLYRIDTFGENTPNPFLFICLNLFLLTVYAGIGTTNLFYVAILILIINFLFQAFYMMSSQKTESVLKNILTSALSFISAGCFLIILFLTSLPETASDYANVIHAIAGNGVKYANDIYILALIGTFIPIIFIGRCLISNLYDKNALETVFINTVSYTMFLYVLARFVGMGAIPHNMVCRYASFAIVSIITMLFVINFVKKNSVSENVIDCSFILKNLSIFGLITASYGYLYKIPAIAILGITSAFAFFITSVTTDLMLTPKICEVENDESLMKNECFRKILPAGLLNIAGIPSLIGFLGWASLVSALSFGIYLKNIELRIISLITISVIAVIYLAILFKTFRIFKSNYSNQIEIPQSVKLPVCKGFSPIVQVLICSFIFVSGTFLEFTCKYIFCPVSFMAGGTNYLEFFKLLVNYAKIFGIFILFTLLALLGYIVIKIIIIKYMQNR